MRIEKDQFGHWGIGSFGESMMVNFGGFLALSFSGWPGEPTSVAFLRGCPLRCPYCHNKWLQSGDDYVRTDYVAALVNRGFAQIPRVIFSGGEPLMQHKALIDIIEMLIPEMEVGLETSGMCAGHIRELLDKDLIDHVFIDLKAHCGSKYSEVTGNTMNGDFLFSQAINSMALCNQYSVPVTVKTTVYKGYPDEAAMEKICGILSIYDVDKRVIQKTMAD